MEVQLKIIGSLFILLAFVHVVFPNYFNWKEELNRLSLINKQIMQVHTLFIALAVLLMGIFCLTSTVEIIHTSLGRRISLGFGIFWSCRLLIQFFGYSTKHWKGKIFETTIHIICSFLWMYVSYVFISIAIA
jgi:hypothetical protein